MFNFGKTQPKPSPITVGRLQGIPEWMLYGEYARLNLYYMSRQGMQTLKASCPHHQHSDNYVMPHDNYVMAAEAHHVEGALKWLNEIAVPALNDKESFSSGARAYVENYSGQALPWDDSKITEQALMTCSFETAIMGTNAIKGIVSLPPGFELDRKKVEKILTKFMKSEKARNYLSEKAEEMGAWWANKFLQGRSAQLFIQAMKADAMSDFNKGLIPVYSVDFGPNTEMSRVLSNNDMAHHASRLPYHTRRGFDFSDAPSAYRWAVQNRLL